MARDILDHDAPSENIDFIAQMRSNVVTKGIPLIEPSEHNFQYVRFNLHGRTGHYYGKIGNSEIIFFSATKQQTIFFQIGPASVLNQLS